MFIAEFLTLAIFLFLIVSLSLSNTHTHTHTHTDSPSVPIGPVRVSRQHTVSPKKKIHISFCWSPSTGMSIRRTPSGLFT